MDGSDNLEQIGAFLEANGSTDDTTTVDNYPAFYYAKDYASQKRSHVSGTNYESGWYLPTIQELFQLRENSETVNAALEACGGTKFELSEDYWSSSQVAYKEIFAHFLRFSNGSDGADNK